jgi:broad specificity phosphatase PhoE
LFLVRHGDAAAGWTDDLDPGLSKLGHGQARHAAESIAPLGPLPLVSSPLRRCRETADAFAERWHVEPMIEPRVGEIESPGLDLTARGPWLAALMAGTWSDVAPALQRWRSGVINALLEIDTDAVVVTHFVAINVAIGAATVDDRVVCRRVANCSTKMLESDGQSLVLVAAPAEVDRTEVL